MAARSSNLWEEERIARWRRAAELGPEKALREAGCSEDCTAETLECLSSAEAQEYLGNPEASDLPPSLDKVLSKLLATKDGPAALLATFGRGITSGLKKLSLPVTVKLPSNESEAIALCVNLSSNSNIQELHLRSKTVFGTLQGCTVLAEALKNNSALHHLSLRSCGIESGDALRRLLDGLQANCTLRTLDLSDNSLLDKGIASVAEFLSTNVTLHRLNLHWTESGSKGADHMASALDRNTSLKKLHFGGNRIGRDGMRRLLEPLSGRVWEEDRPKNTTLNHLDLHGAWPLEVSVEALAGMIRTNKNLSTLGLADLVLLREEWQQIFGALKENVTLEELDLSDCSGSFGDGAVYEALLDLLQFSATGLRQIELGGSVLQSRQGEVDDELRVNSEYRGQLRGQERVQTTSGRLVLCGYPFAGKTAIRKTMHRIEHGTPCNHPFSMVWKKIMALFPTLRRCLFGPHADKELTTRTRGFDILDLSKQSYLASVWDFAGQREYYALHDYLFPNIINSCFLYVCNSRCHPDFDFISENDVKPKSDMRDECQFWMKIIASNSKTHQVGNDENSQLPQVRFVLTHKDTLKSDALDTSIQYANEIVKDLGHKFRYVIDLYETVEVVDAHSLHDVKRLMMLTNSCLEKVLQNQTEYAVCKPVRQAIRDWSAKNPSKPVMSLEDFKSLCGSQVRLSAPRPYMEALLKPEGRETVLSYLSDTGDLIFPKGLDFIVINPRWFGLGVLGSLINATTGAEDFHHQKERMNTGILGCLSKDNRRLHHQDCIVERRNIKSLLEQLQQTIPSDKLIQLMIHLELCFETEPGNEDSSLFNPALFDDRMESAGKGIRQLEWKLERTEPFYFLGRRLECENKSITFLTPGFFPRLQVHLRNYFHERAWTANRGFEVRRNLIRFAENGIDVLVEYSGDIDYFVDVLVRSSKPYAVALQFVQEHVLKTIVQFCASPQGCQGVLLVEAVIRPKCVQDLHLCVNRKDHSALVSTVKARLAEDGGYEHTWSHGIYGVRDTDFARDLLEGEGSYTAVLAASQPLSQRGPTSFEASNSKRSDSDYLSSVQQQLPRLFYPSIEDISWLRRLEQMLNVTKVMPIKLHLMCDHKDGSHKVEGQPGRIMKLNWKANGYDLPLAKFALSLLWAGVGFGVSLASRGASFNLSQVDNFIQNLFDVRGIPDISAETLNQLMNRSETLTPVSEREILKMLERFWKIDPYTEGLKNIWNLQDGDKFCKDFQLRKVVYTEASHQNRIGWVCDSHYKSGLKQRILQSVPLIM